MNKGDKQPPALKARQLLSLARYTTAAALFAFRPAGGKPEHLCQRKDAAF